MLVAAAVTIGCGNKYRPVVNPVQPTGPAGTAAGGYAMVLTQPALRTAASATNPCPTPLAAPTAGNPSATTLYAQPSIATVIDFSGDSILAQAAAGYGPLTTAISPDTNEVYSLNCDGTISGIPLTSTLQANNISTTTLFAAPTTTTGGVTTLGAAYVESNLLVQNAAIYTVDKDRSPNSVGALNAGSPPALLQEIPVAPAVVALAGSPSSQRVYAISQGADGNNVTWGQCADPTSVTTNGQVDGIDTATNAVSSRIPVGTCPVFGLTSPDGLRTFILNRGSGTVSVINAQQDTLDTSFTSNSGQPGTIQVGAGPVYAAYYPATSLLVTANYDSGTITFISVPVDAFGNDAAGFGTVLKTVSVGSYPAALSILGDGSRVYVVLQGDPTNATASGAIAIVNATSFNLQNTIAVPGHPRVIASTYNNPEGKVYTVAPDSETLTILRTDTDTISAQLALPGCGVDVHTNYQYVGQSTIAGNAVTANTIVNMSNSPGSGAPTTPFVCTTTSQ
ncbi:YncE family protein [Acidipila sp. EB88]|nr:YncE family protein [Acidipila sp. EB88]